MKNKLKRLCVMFLCMTLFLAQVMIVEADGSTASASDFQIEGDELVKYKGTSKSVSIPTDVESIGKQAFENNDTITSVNVPKSVKLMGAYAFWGCDNLSRVTLGSGLKEVGDYVFANCKGLTEITIPSNIRSIGIQAFADCTNLKVIKIPTEVTFIHETAFDGCVNLIIDCEEGSYADNYAKEFYKRQKKMPNYSQSDVPTGTDKEEQTKDNKNSDSINSITVPVTNGMLLGASNVVGNHAYVMIDREEQNVLDGDIIAQNILDNAGLQFQGKAEDSFAKYTIVDGAIVADQAYYQNEQIGFVELPGTIKEIGQFAFARSSLRKIVLPEGLEQIDYGAFYGCDGLVSLVLPGSIRSVEPKAIEGTAYLEAFEKQTSTDFLISGNCLLAYKGDSAKVKIPSGVEVIAAEVFKDHKEITTVQFPESLVSIGEGAFENCSGLTKAAWSNGLEEIKDRAFYGTTLKSVTIPKTVTEMGLKVFNSDTIVNYQGALPTETHQFSAERLNNAAYRSDGTVTTDEKKVHVKGPAHSLAVFSDTDSAYYLTIENTGDITEFLNAYTRLGLEFPQNYVGIYDLFFTDTSGVPITKLGKQQLTVILPLSEEASRQKLSMVTLDRNGQLEAVPCDRVRLEDTHCIRFVINTVSSYAIIPSGESYLGEELVLDGTVSLK